MKVMHCHPLTMAGKALDAFHRKNVLANRQLVGVSRSRLLNLRPPALLTRFEWPGSPRERRGHYRCRKVGSLVARTVDYNDGHDPFSRSALEIAYGFRRSHHMPLNRWLFRSWLFDLAFTTAAFAVGVDGAATSSSIAVILINGTDLICTAHQALD